MLGNTSNYTMMCSTVIVSCVTMTAMCDDAITDLTAIMLLDPSQVEKCQEKCNDIIRLLVTDQIKHDYPNGKQLVNLSHTFVVSYHESFCYHGESCNHSDAINV